jgi:hypothetical protein
MVCPYLVKIDETHVGLNFQDPRELLLCIGWVMATSDIFGRFEEKVLMRAIREIDEVTPEMPLKGNGGKSSGESTVSHWKQVNLRSEGVSLSGIHKALLCKLNNIDNLRQKK